METKPKKMSMSLPTDFKEMLKKLNLPEPNFDSIKPRPLDRICTMSLPPYKSGSALAFEYEGETLNKLTFGEEISGRIRLYVDDKYDAASRGWTMLEGSLQLNTIEIPRGFRTVKIKVEMQVVGDCSMNVIDLWTGLMQLYPGMQVEVSRGSTTIEAKEVRYLGSGLGYYKNWSELLNDEGSTKSFNKLIAFETEMPVGDGDKLEIAPFCNIITYVAEGGLTKADFASYDGTKQRGMLVKSARVCFYK